MPIARIASIYFYPVHAERTNYGGYYQIPAVPHGSDPHILVIEDKAQREEGPYIASSLQGRRQKLTYMVQSMEIAMDLIKTWTKDGVGMTPECHPGIWMVRDRLPIIKPDGVPEVDAMGVPQWRDATEEEKRQMWTEDFAAARAADAKYGEYLVLKGDEIDSYEAGDPRKFPGISDVMRAAAKHYGIERKWLRTLTSADTVPCPICTAPISSRAMKCPHCQGVVDVERYAKQEAALALALRTAKQQQPQPAA